MKATAEGSRALGANERVDFKHGSDEMGPSASGQAHWSSQHVPSHALQQGLFRGVND